VAAKEGDVISFLGTEEDIYGLEVPHRVTGVHGRLIEEALHPHEVILHFLLCPKWESTTRPFGLQASRASHALCLTAERLLVARVSHGEDRPPTSFSIDRSALIGFEFGQALLMSWLALYVRRGEAVVKEALFFPRHGNHHLAALLRTWRQSWPTFGPPTADRTVLPRGAVLQEAGAFHERFLTPLLLPEEVCLKTYQRPPIWESQWGWFGPNPVGLAYWGTLLRTDRSLFYVRGQPPQGRKGYVFAHNLSCFSLAQTHHVECGSRRTTRNSYPILELTFACAEGPKLEILFPQEQASAAQRWALELLSHRKAG
jgi:hypothetical protein